MDYLHIASKDNKYVKLVRSLEQKKYRVKNNLFMAEGIRNCQELIASPLVDNIDFVLFDESKAEHDSLATVLVDISKNQQLSAKIFAVESNLFKGVSDTKTSQGLILVVKQPANKQEVLSNCQSGIVILDGLQDPGNIGTILRTAWAAGLSGAIMVGNNGDIYNPKVVRSAMGAVYNLPIVYMTNEEALAFCHANGFAVLVADAMGKDFRDFDLPKGQKPAWLLGNEGNGPSDFWQQAGDFTISIPMSGGVDSLNVAVAAGILLFSKI